MQYLSRAYQYYSGINPATLTGAIDVIVVEREADSPGDESTLSCSPFHVRFGKLQVLRAGEKRVTLTVNDSPMPFFMKVGDAGEAFFVVETDENVPDELLTSPLIQATEPGKPSPASVSSKPPGAASGTPDGNKTNPLPSPPQDEDTGAAERRVHDQKFGVVADRPQRAATPSPTDEPEFLDLDATAAPPDAGPSSAPLTHAASAATLRDPYPSPPPSPPLDGIDAEAAVQELGEQPLPTKEVPFSVDPEKANMAGGMANSAGGGRQLPFPSADDGDIPVDSALDAQVEAEVLRSYSEPPEPAVHADKPAAADGSPGSDTAAAGAVSSSSSTHFAKSLRLSSQQLKALGLKKGANTVTFSVTSSYSGMATCSARIFLWDADDHIVISDIDGTITKSDALGHLFNAVGRDWTHLGVAKLYTDIVNNGYKIMYLTSRAIGQADSTRDYLRNIQQGKYQLPEGPVIMSPDRLMTSLHREVILRKPEVFKMACLRDIQRLFGPGRTAFYAGFGNRITDAMSYRSVNIPSSRIFTIDSNGEVRMELLELAGHRSSYIFMNDLVDQMFPPVHVRSIPEFTDFNFWRADSFEGIELPDLSPPSPALSARSDTSTRLSVFRNLTGSLRGSRSSTPVSDAAPRHGRHHSVTSSGPSSPLFGPVLTSDSELSEEDEDGVPGGSADAGTSAAAAAANPHSPASELRENERRRARASSMPGSLPDSDFFGAGTGDVRFDELSLDDGRAESEGGDGPRDGDDDDEDDPDQFDDDLLATGEMGSVPF